MNQSDEMKRECLRLRAEYRNARKTLSPLNAIKRIANGRNVEDIRFLVSYAQVQRICKSCWQEFKYQKVHGLRRPHLCHECWLEYVRKASREKSARETGTHYHTQRVGRLFYTPDELYHNLVEVEHTYTPLTFGEAIQDVIVRPSSETPRHSVRYR